MIRLGRLPCRQASYLYAMLTRDASNDRPVNCQEVDIQRIPFRNIWCHCGVTAFVSAKARASVRYAPVSKVPPSRTCQQSSVDPNRPWEIHPVSTAMKNNAPARFPKKLTTHVLTRSRTLHRRCRSATTEYMQ